MNAATATKPVMTVLRSAEFRLAGTELAGELREALDTIGQMQDVVAFLIRWHDQLTPADVQRAKDVLAKFAGEAA